MATLVNVNGQTAIDVSDTSETQIYDLNLDSPDPIATLAVQSNITDTSDTDPGAFIDGVKASGTFTVVDYTSLAGKTVTVAGHVLTEGAEWTAAVSNNATADSLASAIDALAEVSAANPPAAIITVLAASVGTAGNSITTTTNGAAALTAEQATLGGGIASDINDTDDEITITGHEYETGQKVNFDKVTGTVPTGLVDNTDYYVIAVDDDTIQLATTYANAVAGTQIDITGAAAGSGSFTLTSSTLSVVQSLLASNDGENFTSLGVDITSTGDDVTVWNIPNPCYKYLRFSATFGGGSADVEVILHGRAAY